MRSVSLVGWLFIVVQFSTVQFSVVQCSAMQVSAAGGIVTYELVIL